MTLTPNFSIGQKDLTKQKGLVQMRRTKTKKASAYPGKRKERDTG